MTSVQYIIVRKDLIEQMGIGKTAAQVAHASLGVLIEDKDGGYYLKTNPQIKQWFNGPFTKLVVYVKSKQKLLNIAKELDKLNIETKLIYDRCLTMLKPEESDGTILTCMGIMPMLRKDVPKCLKKLQLL